MDDNHIAGHLPSARSRRNLDGFAGRVLRNRKSGDAVGRPSCRSSLLGDPGAKFLVETGDSNRTMKNSLNYVSTCLRVVDTRRVSPLPFGDEIFAGTISSTSSANKAVAWIRYV